MLSTYNPKPVRRRTRFASKVMSTAIDAIGKYDQGKTRLGI